MPYRRMNGLRLSSRTQNFSQIQSNDPKITLDPHLAHLYEILIFNFIHAYIDLLFSPQQIRMDYSGMEVSDPASRF